MGLISSSYRVMYLTSYKISLESKMQWIMTAQMDLTASANEILALGNDLDPENPAVKQLEARREKLIVLEKKLNLQMQEYQNRIQIVEAQLQAEKQNLQNAIQSSFSYR